MDPLTIAFSLAQFAPGIIKWITGDDKSAAVAAKVVDVARVVTGKAEPTEVVAALQSNPDLVLQFRQRLVEIEAELDRLYLLDLQDARKRDAAFLAAGKRNVRADILAALAVISVIVLTVAIWRDPSINEYVKGTFTLVLGRFLGYIDQIYSFEFGSTRSNKTKDETINQLTGRQK